ncbi:MAG: OprO/OprP family phosphate-selective porin [Pseudomonadota bacterium]|nr:OprO/OprP family phosphate-selective porin [Pseudomonadota bacterium]
MRKTTLLLATLSAASIGNLGIAADLGSNTTVGGQAFLDFSNIKLRNQNAAGAYVDSAPTGTGFDAKRFYLSVDHKFDDVWSANLTTDAQYSSSTTAGSGGVTEVFIKKLYLQYKLDDAFVVHAGAYTSPWAPFVEGLYGYRYIEKTQTDRLGFAQTADWGLNATGTAADKKLVYSASVVNGGGYKNPSRTKDVDFEGRIGVLPVSWLTLGAGFYSGHLGQVTAVNSGFAKNTATRWDLTAGVNVVGFRVGAEYFDAKNYKTASATTGSLGGPAGVVIATSATGTVVDDEASGVSTWASYNFTNQVSVFGRYDRAKLSKKVDTGLKDTYFNVGVAYKPYKPLDLALVYKHEKVDRGLISISGADANGSYAIGGVNPATGGKFDEVGVYAQYNF